ncbi:MAG: methylenetetrahydrofolate--tRNA-(uracil(54)-C(5))-methyltransferase (FADH(2)-oxidizing) TrmFO [Coriobacteriia bacterium]|nr:methylenetetrahydrofolate--tRNA-(uracil(54)-C(5))-methyltransferase (FADH(2)-oxidizing) TrmFO [Coriobacteriia bacterium]MCL2536995.1 methylenetetrahydrofolate--tRNA-(uracil(54)-C(5))-methyltransferase (FADH(2)-oxidizing) TrmFO [Coriobacteriia bacterium]
MLEEHKTQSTKYSKVTIIGAGLAGSEAALQLADRGVPVKLFEMRPAVSSPAHHTALCAELVCSNSLKSNEESTAAGTLKKELILLGSRLLAFAYEHRVPAGGALAVDREAFAGAVTACIEAHPLIEFIREECTTLDDAEPVIVAAGPLASDGLAAQLRDITGDESLAFYDAAAPIMSRESLDMSKVFAASRYGKGDGDDYLNCALNEEEYERFYHALISAARVTEKDFEQKELFHACQPVEEIARKGYDALRFGAMKPVGIDDPRTGRYPFALVQLRKETSAGELYNLVGFQTNLRFGEQKKVFSLIPGLEQAEIVRYGVMHRNTFVDAPRVMQPNFALSARPNIFLAGQICGTEGYLEAVGSGLMCALNVYSQIQSGLPPRFMPFVLPLRLPPESVLGALFNYSFDPSVKDYQPMHVNYGLMPPFDERIKNKRERYRAYSKRAQAAVSTWVDQHADRLYNRG